MKNWDFAADQNSFFFDNEPYWKIAILGLPWGRIFLGLKWSIFIPAARMDATYIQLSDTCIWYLFFAYFLYPMNIIYITTPSAC